VEGLGLTQFADAYRGRPVLLTGHTGFKGSWLALWLTELGARVTGVSLPAGTSPNHWDLLGLKIDEQLVDIRDASAVAAVFQNTQPEIVFHLAAQALVRRSYHDPLETWSTNVMGTANVLEACRQSGSVRAIVVVTTDKCYENRKQKRGYRETDRLGGHEPYSASKAGAEIVTASYRKAFFEEAGCPLVATARAGNVIGGGDWSEDRLVPDLVRAVASGVTLEIRSPNATRPWQHVLESLAGYLLLGRKLIAGERVFEGAWNFGPDDEQNWTVTDLLLRMKALWPQVSWEAAKKPQPHETQLLCLDSRKAREELAWQPTWTFDAAVRATAEWYSHYLERGEVDSRAQLRQYVVDARAAGRGWSNA
jgi:CDP-glucose 4,6-dehydratase